MHRKQSALIKPSKAKIIFDENQAFQLVQFPKINRSITSNQPNIQKVVLKVDKSTGPQTPQELFFPSLKNTQQQSTESEQRLKKWSVNYKEDIKKRFSMMSEPDEQNEKFLEKWKSMQALPKKKSRTHKTKFKIIKSYKNQENIKSVISNFIENHKSLDTEEVIRLKDFEEKSPFFLNELDFADRLILEKEQLKEKYGFDEKNLRKNNLILESVLLMRMQKRENNRNKNRGFFPQLIRTQQENPK